MAKWREGCKPDEVAKRLEKAKHISGTAEISFSGFEHTELLVVLGGMVEFREKIPELERKRILSSAVSEAGKAGKITPKALLKKCQVLESAYLRKPCALYRLYTGVSVARTISIAPIRIANSTITFNPRAVNATEHRQQLYKVAKDSLGFELPRHYTNVAITIRSRSPYEAAQRALESIDLVRALWNLSINRGASWRISWGRHKPVNDILLSPFHTIHNADGTTATSDWWYDPSFREPVAEFKDKAKFGKVVAFSAKLRSAISKSSYADDLCDALIRYVRALDSVDLNDAFLRMWGILEYLTDTTSASYKVTVRRAAFLFADNDYSVQALTHLMNHRNRFVHAGSESDEVESLVYLLKRYVDALFLFHIGTKFKFQSRSDAAQFMDLPPSKEQIEVRIKRLRDAKKFVSGA